MFKKEINRHRFCYQKRQVLEETNQLDPRMSALEDDMDEEDMEEDEDDLIKKVALFSSLRNELRFLNREVCNTTIDLQNTDYF